MDIIKVNLAIKKHRTTRGTYILFAAVALIVLMISGFNIHHDFQNVGEIKDYSKKIGRIAQNRLKKIQEMKEIKARWGEEEIKYLQDTAAFINSLIAKDIFPWDRLLDELERRIPSGITLDSFSPSDNFKEFTIQGFSLSTTDISRLLNNLDRSNLIKTTKIYNIGFSERNLETEFEERESDIEDINFKIKSTINMDWVFPTTHYQGLVTVLPETKQ